MKDKRRPSSEEEEKRDERREVKEDGTSEVAAGAIFTDVDQAQIDLTEVYWISSEPGEVRNLQVDKRRLFHLLHKLTSFMISSGDFCFTIQCIAIRH